MIMQATLLVQTMMQVTDGGVRDIFRTIFSKLFIVLVFYLINCLYLQHNY
jgi:hypothetical protein